MNNALTWADLFTNGSLVDIDIGEWDGLTRMIPEDVAIEKTDAVKAAITLGHNRLVPATALDAIRKVAGEARKAVDDVSIPFKLVPGSRFVPKAQREALKARLVELRTRFQLAVNEFIDKFDETRGKHRSDLRAALTEAAKGDMSTVERAMNRIEGLYPTEAKLREKFKISWSVYSIAAPRDCSDDGEQGDAITRELGSMVDRLREQLIEKTRDIMELAGRGGKITQKTYNSAIRVCDRLDSLNIFCDAGLREAVRAVRNAVSAAAGSEDPGAALKGVLESIPEELAKSRELAIDSAAKMFSGQAERRFGL